MIFHTDSDLNIFKLCLVDPCDLKPGKIYRFIGRCPWENKILHDSLCIVLKLQKSSVLWHGGTDNGVKFLNGNKISDIFFPAGCLLTEEMFLDLEKLKTHTQQMKLSFD